MDECQHGACRFRCLGIPEAFESSQWTGECESEPASERQLALPVNSRDVQWAAGQSERTESPGLPVSLATRKGWSMRRPEKKNMECGFF